MKTDYNKLKTEFLDYLEKERGFSDYTVQSYNTDIKIFFDFCRKLDVYFGVHLDKVKPLTIRNFLADEMAKIQSSKSKSKSSLRLHLKHGILKRRDSGGYRKFYISITLEQTMSN